MDNKSMKVARFKKASFYNRSKNCHELDNDAETRLGISIADEKARAEHRKMKMEAPPSIEEQIFQNNL